MKTKTKGIIAIAFVAAGLAWGAIVNGYSDYTKLGSVPANPGAAYGRVFVGPSGLGCIYSTGASCFTGTSGVSGPSGVSGLSGVSGPSGASGIQGVSGLSGVAGPSGVSGLSGVAGPSGISGATGPSGPSGPSGVSGISGTAGASAPINWGSYGTSAVNLVTLNGAFGPLFGTGTPGVTEALVQSTVSVATSITNLRVNSGNIGAGDALTVTLRVNGVSSALTCTVAASGTACNDTTHSVAVVAGDLVSVIFASSGISLPTSTQLSYGVSQTGAMGPSGGMVQISQIVANGSSGTIDFSSIPATYTNLLIIASGRVSDSASSKNIYIEFNSDTGSNYLSQGTFGSNTTASAFSVAAATPQSQNGILALPGATATTSYAGGGSIFVPGYAGTSFFKSAHATGGLWWSNSTSTQLAAQNNVLWLNAGAINDIKLIDVGGGNFVSGSIFTLYGMQ